ncbi:MAG: sodium:proton antiporter [Phycisphaerae bacterium]
MDKPQNASATFIRLHWRSGSRSPGRNTAHRPAVAVLIAIGGGLFAFLAIRILAAASSEPNIRPPTWLWCAPFITLLAAIAWFPWKWPRVWKWIGFPVSAGLALLVIAAYGMRLHTLSPIAENISAYVQFMAVIAAFYCVCSNLSITLRCRPTPANNLLLLLTAAAVANVIGTAGATMLLIGPFLNMNRRQLSPLHIFFFVAVVANIGGLLTPLGDPPLMAGYLYGVPFWWMLLHAWPMWCVAMAFLLSMFYWLQRRNIGDIDVQPSPGPAVVEIENLWLLVPLAFCIAALFLPAADRVGILTAAAVGVAILYRRTGSTEPGIHDSESLPAIGYGPLREMASLFLGLFITMTPVLAMISHLPPAARRIISTPAEYFLTVGTASSVLDNTPTYIAGLQLKVAAGGRVESPSRPLVMPSKRVAALAAHPRSAPYLLAIAMGAVMFGAMTWIGNGPNLLVEMIARRQGIEPPSFGGYLFRYSIPILLPLLAVMAGWLWLLGG